MLKRLFTFLLLILFTICLQAADKRQIMLEAESFDSKGGWVVDNQSMMQMGSPYLLAHGLGRPVEDACTVFNASQGGTYRLWVRTRDWCATWGRTESPGRFQVVLNGKTVPVLLGTEGATWHWQDAGRVSLRKGENHVALHDLTGFEGRCDALFFSMDGEAVPPEERATKKPHSAGKYDLVVVGGGIAGCCAALSAARLGCRVALVQARPVLGGNNSSEVRVGPSGLIAQEPYPKLGYLLDELCGVGHWTNHEAKQDTTLARSRKILSILKEHPEKMIHNAGPASNYEDERKLSLIQSEKNITLFLNTQVVEAHCKNGRIRSVVGQDIESGERIMLEGTLFADCTGDGNLGFLAGADFRMGREGKALTEEARAPEKPDSLVMGMSVQWYSEKTKNESAFPDCPWAVEFTDSTCVVIDRGDWNWEAGLDRNQVEEAEYIRDYALRALYGNWSYLKNHYSKKADFSCKRLAWAAYIGGKRESRRLLGDIILREQDILDRVPYEDATFTTTWSMDLHYPKTIPGFQDEPFLSYSKAPSIHPYAVPYRCLYSRNVDNLFMAGRDISVTHVVLGTVRVMRTGGMMGEVVGMAASICKEKRTSPRGVYDNYLPELKVLMSKGSAKESIDFPDDQHFNEGDGLKRPKDIVSSK